MSTTTARAMHCLVILTLTLTTASSARAQSVAYGSGGYRFTSTGASQLNFPWQMPGYDDSGWGIALPNRGVGTGSGCPLVGDDRWPLGSDLLVRQQVALPGQASSVELGFAFDNDIVAVYWNGQQIHGEVRHEGCATRDSLVIQVPTALLRRGEVNLLALRLRDRGVVSYYDHRITVR